MKYKFQVRLIIASIFMTWLLALSLLSCTTQAAREAEPQAPNPPAATPVIPEAPSPPPNTPPAATTEPQTPAEQIRVAVVYFHRAQRCHSCRYAEEQTVLTLESYFADELETGEITFTSVNVQDENNADIIEQYGAYSSQLFINVAEGDNENIEEVIEFWDFIDDDEGFSLLVRTKITDALGGTD
jgi:hypothetical protein